VKIEASMGIVTVPAYEWFLSGCMVEVHE